MPHHVVHFAIHADDIQRAKRFYEETFGWHFQAWGPPDFFLISTGTDEDPGIHGALQRREEPATSGGMTGYECTIAVDDLASIRDAIVRHGGIIDLEPFEIPEVGRLIRFRDTEGNRACAMQ